MRRLLSYFTFACLFCLLALTIPAPTTRTVKAAEAPPERCEQCVAAVQARYDQCLAMFGSDVRGQRCHDQFNEGIVQCYRNFCEQ